ncbi:phytanoyl-CoA dioxygenase family protein [Xanthovirga aplysinae]|uniref:phytanoyl-CoA dioxygenase family protein n=1 Tax=Xanthovirga aplysinae TaxID=2529853 RepID=UPI0012BD623A|nr:phytanoyl-CoA dioxygenase family protein [Xanthovirga aplysinae]MTI33388.1 phytanoyl-CoA dioxygenase [Xanthovirga aplysinae]
MNNHILAIKFWEEGYLHLENFFPPEMMDQFNELILGHYGLNPNWEHNDEFIEKSATEVIPWFPMREGVMIFEKIEKNAEFARLSAHILGEGWSNLYCMAMFSKKGTKGQAWHQDCPPENPHQFNLNRLVYTHDISPDIGGKVILVPGSHKKGELPKGEPHADMEGQVVLSPKKGDVVFLHGHVWHRVLPITGKYRISTNFRAMPKDTPEEITDIAVYRNMRYRFSTSEVIEER